MKNYIKKQNVLINYQKLDRLIFLKGKSINDGLVRKHFLVQNLRSFLKKFKKLKNNTEKK